MGVFAIVKALIKPPPCDHILGVNWRLRKFVKDGSEYSIRGDADTVIEFDYCPKCGEKVNKSWLRIKAVRKEATKPKAKILRV